MRLDYLSTDIDWSWWCVLCCICHLRRKVLILGSVWWQSLQRVLWEWLGRWAHSQPVDCFDLCWGNPRWSRTGAVLGHGFHALETRRVLLLQLTPHIWISALLLAVTFTAKVLIPSISTILLQFSVKFVGSSGERSPMRRVIVFCWQTTGSIFWETPCYFWSSYWYFLFIGRLLLMSLHTLLFVLIFLLPLWAPLSPMIGHQSSFCRLWVCATWFWLAGGAVLMVGNPFSSRHQRMACRMHCS